MPHHRPGRFTSSFNSMYLDQENLPAHHKVYWDLVHAFLKAAPSALGLIDEISEHLLGRPVITKP